MSHADHHAKPGYERTDVNMKVLVLTSVVSVVAVAISLICVDNYFVIEKEKAIVERQLAPVSVTLRDLRAREDEALGSYKLIDSTSGRYQLPIERAMELVAEEAYRSSQGAGR